MAYHAPLRNKDTYHTSKHAAKTPHVQGIVIILQINQEFRPLEISGNIGSSGQASLKMKQPVPFCILAHGIVGHASKLSGIMHITDIWKM